MSEQTALEDHADEVILPIIALESGYNGAVVNITKDLPIYVNSSGSDDNDGYAPGAQHAFQTGTRAYQEATRYTVSNGAQIIINLGDGVFLPIEAVGVVAGSSGSDYPVVIRGNGSSTNILKTVAPTLHNSCIVAAGGAKIRVENLKVGGNGLGNGIMATDGGRVDLGPGIEYGAIQPAGGVHIGAWSGGVIWNYSDYVISGGATRHLEAWGEGAFIEGGSKTVTITQAVEFTSSFAEAGANGYLYDVDTDYVGRELVTGRRFYAYQWGYINTENSGLNYFPGTIDGLWETGGAYDTMGGANQGPPGVAGPMGPKAFSLQLPVAGDEVGMFYTKEILTITRISAVVRGTTPGVVWSLRYAAGRNAVGTPVITLDTNTTSQVGNNYLTFDSPSIPANNWVWLKVVSTSGVVLEFDMSLQF